MGVPRAVRERYARDAPSLQRVYAYVRETLGPWCSAPGYGLDGRIKSVESAAEKLCAGRLAKWSDFDDLVAFTVVVPTRSHEEAVLAKLRTSFAERTTRERGATFKSPDTFRFDATRWYGTVRDEPTPPQLEEVDLNAVFEVQIHTAFDHAWSTVTHDLVYKGQGADWQGRRLAAQLKAVAEQLDLLIDTFDDAAATIPESMDTVTAAETKILTVFRLLDDDGLIGDEVRPQSWQRFAECVYGLARKRTRGSREAAKVAATLCDDFDAAVRGGTFVVAGSGLLFQAVVAFALASWGSDALKDSLVVWDEDLTELYEGSTAPLPIDLES